MAVNEKLWLDLAREFRELPDSRRNPMQAEYTEIGWGTAVAQDGQDRWLLSGGHSAADRALFKETARRAAAALRLGTGPQAWTKWLDLLRSAPTSRVEEGLLRIRNADAPDETVAPCWTLHEVREASARQCLTCAANEVEASVTAAAKKARLAARKRRARRRQRRRAMPHRRGGAAGASRAEWLRSKLKERGWTRHDLERNNGPHWKTTNRILDGKRVRQTVLHKIARALGIDHSDIPAL